MFHSSEVGKFDEKETKLQHPFSLILSGPRRAGKTQFMKKLILNAKEKIYPPIEQVVWFYATEQTDVFIEIRKSLGKENVTFVKGLPKNTTIEEDYIEGRPGPKLIVIDDLMSEANTREDVNQLFTRGRHLDTSIAFLVQNFHNKGKYMRENTLNADYLALFKNPRDATLISYLAQQMGQRKLVMDAFRLATDDKEFTYLFVDLRSDTDDRLRLRSDILSSHQRVFLDSSKTYK